MVCKYNVNTRETDVNRMMLGDKSRHPRMVSGSVTSHMDSTTNARIPRMIFWADIYTRLVMLYRVTVTFPFRSGGIRVFTGLVYGLKCTLPIKDPGRRIAPPKG